MNRRELISTGIVGLTGATAGCTKDGSLLGPQPRGTEEPNEPPGQQGELESGVIEAGTLKSLKSGRTKTLQFELDYSEKIREDFSISLIAIPTKQFIGVTELNLSKFDNYSELYTIEYDGERLVEERDYWVKRDNRYTFEVGTDSTEPMLELEAGTYTTGLIVDMESEDSPRLLDIEDDSFVVYTTPDDVKNVTLNNNERKIYEHADSYTLKLLHSYVYVNDRDDLMPEGIYVESNFEIPKDELEMVKYIHNPETGPIMEWDEYHKPLWVPEYNKSVEYMNRPLVKDIAERVKQIEEEFDIQEDETLLRIVFWMIRTCYYKQDWDTIEENRSVRYPSHYFMKGYGDCKDMGLLGNSILHHLGFDTTLYLYSDNSDTYYYHLSGAVDCELTEETQGFYEDGTFETADSAGEGGEGGTDFYAFDPSFGRLYATSRHTELKSFFMIPGKE
ncbi:hypothetical protein [Halorubrum halophilum]|uniref:hypothetical protein n=1 Tax=Halorubrum halophilum TaxID=413816 RepID=UPI00186B1C70|nr:hypothetical protein [Halorubrum halophilum]